MDRDVKVTVGFGASVVLLFAFAVHGAIVGLVFEALHHKGRGGVTSHDIVLPHASPAPMDIHGEFMAMPRVNPLARDEKKQGHVPTCACGCVGVCNCPPDCECKAFSSGLGEKKTQGVVMSRPCVNCQPAPSPMQIQQSAPAPKASRYQVAVFVRHDTKSNEVLRWFSQDRNLAALVRNCDYQVYTESNPMYRARFASVIPVTSFPAVAFLMPDGGHIHVAVKESIPSDPATLYADMKRGFAHAMEVRQGVVSNAIRPVSSASYPTGFEAPSSGYDPSCPDGKCPNPVLIDPDGRRPILRPFQDDTPEKEEGPLAGFFRALVWGGVETVALIAFVCFMGFVAVILTIAVAYKFLRS